MRSPLPLTFALVLFLAVAASAVEKRAFRHGVKVGDCPQPTADQIAAIRASNPDICTKETTGQGALKYMKVRNAVTNSKFCGEECKEKAKGANGIGELWLVLCDMTIEVNGANMKLDPVQALIVLAKPEPEEVASVASAPDKGAKPEKDAEPEKGAGPDKPLPDYAQQWAERTCKMHKGQEINNYGTKIQVTKDVDWVAACKRVKLWQDKIHDCGAAIKDDTKCNNLDQHLWVHFNFGNPGGSEVSNDIINGNKYKDNKKLVLPGNCVQDKTCIKAAYEYYATGNKECDAAIINECMPENLKMKSSKLDTAKL